MDGGHPFIKGWWSYIVGDLLVNDATGAGWVAHNRQLQLYVLNPAEVDLAEAVHGLTLSATGTYVGSRYDGNDVDNDRYEKLDAYQVFDTKATYERHALTFFVGVNNFLDERYETSAYSESYYPMPGRNFYGGAELKF